MNRNFLLITLFLFSFGSLAQATKPVANDPARQLQTLSQQARQFIDRQQADSAWQQAIKPGLPLLKQVPDTALVSRLFRREMASIFMEQRKFQEAIKTVKPLLIQCRQVGDKLMEGIVRVILCRAYHNLGMLQECITEALYNINLFQQLPNHDILSLSYTALARAYQESSDTVRAMRYNDLGVQHGKLAGRTNIRIVSFLNDGITLVSKKKYRKAIQSYKTVLRITQEDKTLDHYTATGFVGLAQAFEADKQLNEAVKMAKMGILKARLYNDTEAEIEALLIISSVEVSLGNNKASLAAATDALKLTYTGAPPIARLLALETYSQAQERVGNTAAALKATRQLAALTDSLNQINKAEAIATAETRFGVQAKNATIGLLNKNAALRQQQSRQEQQTAGIVIGFLVLGIGIVGLFWYQARKTGRILQGQKTEIEAQAAQLAEVNGIKDQLFSIVSHDLRGPVMNLQQSLDRLETAPAALAELPRFRESVNAVASLTDNMLCWALGQMGGLRTRPQAVALSDIVSDVLGLYQETIHLKNINLIINDKPAGKPDPLVLTDENQAEIAIRNIVQNALKFSPVGGTLTLWVEQYGSDVGLLITDDGPGFDWQPGESSPGQTATRASTNSTGLGLTVVEDLMRRNGGELQIARRQDGPGTVARLTWPLPSVQNAAMSNNVNESIA
jgi:signal transduction histidine kinase